MKQDIVRILVITNIIALGAVGYFYNQINQVNSVRTTDVERETYGAECVKWITDSYQSAGEDNAAFVLARSWRKHGQMVFEIHPDWDQDEFRGEDVLCVVDKQSGFQFRYTGISREPWLFYK